MSIKPPRARSGISVAFHAIFMSDIDRHMRSKDKPNNLSLDLSLNLKPCLKLNSSEKGLNKYVFLAPKKRGVDCCSSRTEITNETPHIYGVERGHD